MYNSVYWFPLGYSHNLYSFKMRMFCHFSIISVIPLLCRVTPEVDIMTLTQQNFKCFLVQFYVWFSVLLGSIKKLMPGWGWIFQRKQAQYLDWNDSELWKWELRAGRCCGACFRWHWNSIKCLTKTRRGLHLRLPFTYYQKYPVKSSGGFGENIVVGCRELALESLSQIYAQ